MRWTSPAPISNTGFRVPLTAKAVPRLSLTVAGSGRIASHVTRLFSLAL